MTNYYEELNLNKDESLEEINRALSQLESTWKRREITNPEKAAKMIALIIDARNAFGSEQSRRDYDASLIAVPDDGLTGDTQDLSEALNNIASFVKSNQYDIAIMAMEKALPMLDSAGIPDNEKAPLYLNFATIYQGTKNYARALEQVNKAIMIQPNTLEGYRTKEHILNDYIDSLLTNNQDISDLVNNHISTCEIWVQKAKEANDATSVVEALSILANDYYIIRDIDKAEKYASEAVSLGIGDLTTANRVLSSLYSDRDADLQELSRYTKEPDYYIEEVQSLIKTLLSMDLPMESYGFPLLTKKYTWDDSYYEDECSKRHIEQYETFAISKDGKFVNYITEKTRDIRYSSGMLNPRDTTEKNEESVATYEAFPFNMEFDFSGSADLYWKGPMCADYYGLVSDREIHAQTIHEIMYVATQLASLGNFQYKLVRHGSKKGYGLYKVLKDIVDKRQKYDEECKRINALFNKEFESLQAEITEKYESSRETLRQNYVVAAEKAKQQEAEGAEIQNQIEDLSNELSSLGLFAGKRKKELRYEIDELERKLDGLMTVDRLDEMFKEKANTLNQQENEEINKLEKELRQKYPLPEL